MSAVFSTCGKYRHRLDREIQAEGKVALFVGVNPSTAGAEAEDQTTGKWRGFSLRNFIRRYIVVNPFDYCSTDVRQLAKVSAPISADNLVHIMAAIAEADILIPCWGSRDKLPKELRHHLIRMKNTLFESGKPVLIFGLTKSGDPMHPLMLGYDTQLTPWTP
jgi:hypothetical protein